MMHRVSATEIVILRERRSSSMQDGVTTLALRSVTVATTLLAGTEQPHEDSERNSELAG